MSKSVEPRGLDYQREDCNKEQRGQNYMDHSVERGFDMLRYVMVGVGLTLSIFLSAASWHYKRKYENLKRKKRSRAKEKGKGKHPNSNKASCEIHGDRHIQEDTNGVIPNIVARRSARKEMEDLEELLHGGGGELYHEQYNEHGVKIERQETGSQLLATYGIRG